MTLRTIGCLVIFTFGLCCMPCTAAAQPAAKVPRIGYLSAGVASTSPIEVFRQQLHDLGYKNGQSVVIEARWAEGQVERLPALAAELVRLPVDVIFAGGLPPRALRSRPPVRFPLSPLIWKAIRGHGVGRQPGSSVWEYHRGIPGSPELSGKQLELLREAVPGIARVAVLWDPATPLFPLRALEVAAQLLGVTLHTLEVRSLDEFIGAFDSVTQAHAEALFVLSSPLWYHHRARIVDLAVQRRLPVIAMFKEFAQVGALMSYGPNLEEMARHVATYVDRILKGARPAELLIERPTRFELIVNLKTATALGLTIPPTLLFQAHEVIR